MATLRTIEALDAEVNTWNAPDGTKIYFVAGRFTDGETWSVGTVEKYLDSTRQKLSGLIGTEAEFKLEHKGTKDDKNEWKLLDYPGKKPVEKGGIPYPGQNRAGGGRASSGEAPGAPASASYGDHSASIEAQVAAKIAGEILTACIAAGKTPDNLFEFVANGTKMIAQGIRQAASGAVEERDYHPIPNAAPEPAQADSGPSERADRATLIDEALALHNDKAGIEKAYLEVFGDDRGIVEIDLAEITDDDLKVLAGR